MKARLIDEIFTVGKLNPMYRATLEEIIVRIEADGCQVMTRYDISSSSYEAYSDGQCIARVSLKDVDEPMNIVWRLLHEYGHFLSGQIQLNDRMIDREERAWQYADDLKEYPDLLLCIHDYERCKAHDIKTYQEFLGLI